jgi:hypothetical protein
MTASQIVLTPRFAAPVREVLARFAGPALALLLLVVLALAWVAWFRLVHFALVPPHVGASVGAR